MTGYFLKMFGISLGLTLCFEITVFLLLKGKKKDLGPVILVNILTNPAAVFLCFLFRRYLPPGWYLPLQLLVEAAVVFAEGFVFRYLDIKTKRIMSCFLLSLILNGISYLSGMIINALT